MALRSARSCIAFAFAGAIAVGGSSACGHDSATSASTSTSTSSASSGSGGSDPCAADHCVDGVLDCGEVGFDCGGSCADCAAFDVATVCGPGDATLPWANPHLVKVVLPDGTPYDSDIEEPEVRDFGGEQWLFFNDDPAGGNKDLRYARWDSTKSAFVVLGLIPGTGVETTSVDGNPTLDQDGHFFFVSTRTYPNPPETIHEAQLSVSGSPIAASLGGIVRLDGLSRTDSQWVTQGVQVTWDGDWLYFDEAKFDGPVPSQSDIVAAEKNGAAFQRLSDADNAKLLGNLNTPTFLEYAESLSHDGLELYFTRTWAVATQLQNVIMCVMRSTRSDTTQPFGLPVDVSVTLPGPGVLMEAPSLSPDEKTLYYHRRSTGDPIARLYAVDRP